MSADCYSAKSLHMEVSSSRKDKMDANETKKVDQLLQYETVVTSAESKCSQLKGQLERIKQMYTALPDPKTPHSQQSSSKTARRLGSNMHESVEAPTPKELNTIRIPKLIRQNSQAIGTDTSGAALGTINNILSGITKAIPVPEFIQVKPYSVKSRTDIISKIYNEPVHGVEEVKINSRSRESVKSRTKFSLRRSKPKITAIASTTNCKKVKKPGVKLTDRRLNRSSENQTNRTVASTISRKSRKVLAKSRPNKRDVPAEPPLMKHNRNTDLVEIYHNAAVQETKSSDSDLPRKKIQKSFVRTETNMVHRTEANMVHRTEANLAAIPPLNIADIEDKTHHVRGVISCIDRNYTMPTISSRMKQVAKYYMHSFNIKTIPFCPATSTSPSHNIGINIQQVMSMVKSKQPVTRLSPTLAYNIGLAAGKWEEHPVPCLTSSVTTRTFNSQCPLSKSAVNYQHLQEMAKTIPQETIEEADELEEANSPETQTIIITGPSGDVKVTNKKQMVWSADLDEKRCTCVTPKGVGFQQIINKFNCTMSKAKMASGAVHAVKLREPKMDKSSSGEECCFNPCEFTPLQNKEKKLKEVLGKLHEEFEKMTKTYDDLAKKNEEGSASEDTVKQLEMLDKELNHKEEEIVMVMTLYKEVLALKQQVKSLKDRTSKENILIRAQPPKLNGYSVTTAGLLNKLLQRVQHFQTHYKRR